MLTMLILDPVLPEGGPYLATFLKIEREKVKGILSCY